MLDVIERLRANISRVYFGNTDAVSRIIRCLLSRGHVLIEDVPGVGKTILATTIARSIDGQFSRVQLTPDMLPGDLLGVTVYNRDGSRFEFKRGPIFANVVLADEVNRTTPRTQTALLEAMAEGNVSIDGVTHPLPRPFMVLATQNPYEFEGTYPLPENQLDRFLMRLSLGYPHPDTEAELLEARPATSVLSSIGPVIHADELLAMQQAVDVVRLDRTLREYIVRIASATRDHEEIQVGLSPRGSLALAHAARASAFCDGRDYATPDDIHDNIVAVCGHRLITRGYGTGAFGTAGESLLRSIVEGVPSPG